MAIDGTWAIAFNVPGGEKHFAVVLSTEGGGLSGTFDGAPIEDGATDGHHLSFSAQLTSPFKMKIKASGAVEGETISGTLKAGPMMSAKFTGSRTAV